MMTVENKVMREPPEKKRVIGKCQSMRRRLTSDVERFPLIHLRSLSDEKKQNIRLISLFRLSKVLLFTAHWKSDMSR